MAATRTEIERWLLSASEETRRMPEGWQKWMLSRQLGLIARGVQTRRALESLLRESDLPAQ